MRLKLKSWMQNRSPWIHKIARTSCPLNSAPPLMLTRSDCFSAKLCGLFFGLEPSSNFFVSNPKRILVFHHHWKCFLTTNSQILQVIDDIARGYVEIDAAQLIKMSKSQQAAAVQNRVRSLEQTVEAVAANSTSNSTAICTSSGTSLFTSSTIASRQQNLPATVRFLYFC